MSTQMEKLLAAQEKTQEKLRRENPGEAAPGTGGREAAQEADRRAEAERAHPSAVYQRWLRRKAVY